MCKNSVDFSHKFYCATLCYQDQTRRALKGNQNFITLPHLVIGIRRRRRLLPSVALSWLIYGELTGISRPSPSETFHALVG